ncbi:MAG: endonuclease III [Polyangia bacterium]
MTRKEKARRIAAILDELYPRPGVPLGHRDPYTLLVATVLSAQCTDKRVNETAPRLFALASTPEEMARLPREKIEITIRPCGLASSKSRAISALSEILTRDHGGEVPRTFDELEALPGVGHKTAGVVLSQAFGLPAFPVDTHIHRLAARWGLSRGESPLRTERDLKKLWPPESWRDRHLQIIYFGREHCPARGHDLTRCPICSWAASRGRIAEEARKNRKKQAIRAPRSPARRRASSSSRSFPRT